MYCPFHVRVWTSFRRYVLLLCQSYKLTIDRQNNRKRTATVPKKCFSYSRPLHNGLNPGETPSYSAYHQDQNMCISHEIKLCENNDCISFTETGSKPHRNWKWLQFNKVLWICVFSSTHYQDQQTYYQYKVSLIIKKLVVK